MNTTSSSTTSSSTAGRGDFLSGIGIEAKWRNFLAAEKLKRGELVEIHSLNGKPELNGIVVCPSAGLGLFVSSSLVFKNFYFVLIKSDMIKWEGQAARGPFIVICW